MSRWDTLVKVYNHIEDYCVQTGAQDHRELDEGELASMKLDTAYQQDWYDTVEQVCSQRRRKERFDRDLRLAKRSKGSYCSRSVEVQKNPPDRLTKSFSKSVRLRSVELPDGLRNRCTLLSASKCESAPYLKQPCTDSSESTSAYARVSSSSSLKADKLSPDEEVPRLKNENNGLVHEATQLQQHRQVSHQNSLEPQTLEAAEIGAQLMARLKDPLQGYLWDLGDAIPFESSPEIEQSETELESTEPFYHFNSYLKSFGGAQPKEPLQDHEQDSLNGSANASSASKWNFSGNDYLNGCAMKGSAPSPDYEPREFPRYDLTTRARPNAKTPLARSRRSSYGSRNNLTAFDGLIPSAIMTASTSSQSADSTISRPHRRWSLKVIFFKIRQSCLACGCKESAEDMEMESKQAVRLKEKALMPRKENIREMFNAASPPSATSATKGYSSVVYRKTPRASKQTALDKKEEESRARKAPERQQVGGKSSSKCVPTGKWCAKWSRKLRFPAFHSKSSH